MDFTVYIPQTTALQNCSTEYGHVKISASRFEAVLAELKPEERAALIIGREHEILMQHPHKNSYVECDSSEVEDIVKGIQKLYKEQLNERMKVIQESQKVLDHIEADPEHYISKLTLKPKWEAHPERLRQRCEAAHNDNLDHYKGLIERTLKTARANWWDYIKGHVINQMASPGRTYIEVEGERLNWSEILTLSEEYNLAVEPLKEMDRIFKEAEREKEREKEEEYERVLEGRRAWINWCKEYGSEDLKWAIENSYPIGNKYQAEVIDALLPDDSLNYSIHPTIHDDHGLRRVPNKDARSLLEALKAQVECTPNLPAHTTLEVGQIHSVSLYVDCDCEGEGYCDKCDEDLEVKVKRTAIPVTVKAPHIEHKVWYVIEED